MRERYTDDAETGAFPAERVFRSKVDLRYVFEPAIDRPAAEPAIERPDALIVAFSAAHEPDEPPRYYMTRVLRALPCHRLFILDDHGPCNLHARPSWYLGKHRSGDVPAAVDGLMEAITTELGLDRARVLTCGASKGGWAALYFGARFGAGHAVAGEPQAFLGRHLLQDGTWDIAAHVAGGTEPTDGEYLDSVLFDAFRGCSSPPSVHLFCGRQSPYYARDVLPLTRFFRTLGVTCELTLADYEDHVPDLGLHFPGYLTARLNSLLGPPGDSTHALSPLPDDTSAQAPQPNSQPVLKP
jgi:hypothetical protein